MARSAVLKSFAELNREWFEERPDRGGLPRDWDVRYSEDQPRDDDGKWTSEGGGSSSSGPAPTGITGMPADSKPATHYAPKQEEHEYEFVSPSVADDLDFKTAVAALDGQPQAALRDASLYINGALGVKAVEHNVVGAWADGAENSVMDIVDNSEWDKLVLAGAMKGYIANQKQVLVFQQKSGGVDTLYKFEATGNLVDIHKNLLQDGLAYHTLIPHKGGATVYVADIRASGTDPVDITKGAARYDAKVQVEFGHGEFLGDQKHEGTSVEQRNAARASYEADIRKSKVHGSAELWDRVRDRWGQGLAQNIGVHASDIPDATAVKAQWIARSPIQTREELFAGSPENKKTLDAAGAHVADATGARYKPTGNKKDGERVSEKLETRSPAGLTDIVRSTVIVTSPEQADAVVAELGKMFPVTDEGFKKTKVGYVDRAVNVRFDNGQIGEVLIMSPEMEWAKSDKGGHGHDFYVEWRKASTPEDRKAELKAAQLKVYGEAIDRQPEVWNSAHPVPI